MQQRPLTAADLLPRPLARLGRHVFVLDTVGSTNDFLLERAAVAGDGALAWAEQQTAGRGRLGRRWHAPRGSSILLSVLLHESPPSPLLTHAALLGAVAACEAVVATTDCAPGVRWPNDLVLNGRKLGGVLAESCALPAVAAMLPGGRPRALVLGIGLNVLQQRAHFAGELAGQATSLECESNRPVDRAAIAAALLARLDAWVLETLRPGGVPRLLAAWRDHCGDFGTRVTLLHDGRSYSGTAVDLTAEGDLIVQLEHGGRRRFVAATTTRAW